MYTAAAVIEAKIRKVSLSFQGRYQNSCKIFIVSFSVYFELAFLLFRVGTAFRLILSPFLSLGGAVKGTDSAIDS